MEIKISFRPREYFSAQSVPKHSVVVEHGFKFRESCL
jgi:hypothetical protein